MEGHAPTVDRGLIEISKLDVRARINADLTRILALGTITPYVALDRIRRVLAYYHVFIPGVQFLEGLEGEHRFEVTQFGDKLGAADDGRIITHDEINYELVFRWVFGTINFSCSAKLVAKGDTEN